MVLGQLDRLIITLDSGTCSFLYVVSLSEFGKHVPKEKPTPSLPTTTSLKDRPPDSDLPSPPQGMEDLEDMFSEEFVAQAEAQLDEAMKMFSSQNPALWQQFQTFAKSMGLEEGAQFPPPFASQGESSVDGTERQEREGGARGDSAATASSLDAKLEETLKKLRESTQKIEVQLPVYLSHALQLGL